MNGSSSGVLLVINGVPQGLCLDHSCIFSTLVTSQWFHWQMEQHVYMSLYADDLVLY